MPAKAVRREWETTVGELVHELETGRVIARGYNNAPDPYPPSGKGWRLISAVANLDMVYWFWEREV